jgi:ferredoxin
MLSNKGANVIGGFLTRGHVTHPAPHMFDRFPERPDPTDLDRANHFVDEIIDCVNTGQSMRTKQNMYRVLGPELGFYSILGLISSDRVVRLILPQPSLNRISCDKCRLCADECPMDNIALNPYPVIGDLCIRCYRCFSVCPQRALNINWKIADPFLWFFYNTFFIRWFGDLVPGEQIYSN